MHIELSKQAEAAMNKHLASGQYASPEDLLLTALDSLTDQADMVDDLKESLADEEAGRMKPLSQVAASIRERHGYRSPE